jgi:hypothetical protein
MTRYAVAAASPVRAGIADLLGVLLFVAIGRASHAEALSIVGFAATAWPFVAGLAVGWVIMRAWRRPGVVRWTGIGIWMITVVVGLLLRVASGDGAPTGFVVVAAAVLGVLVLGWRGVMSAVVRRRRQRV